MKIESLIVWVSGLAFAVLAAGSDDTVADKREGRRPPRSALLHREEELQQVLKGSDSAAAPQDLVGELGSMEIQRIARAMKRAFFGGDEGESGGERRRRHKARRKTSAKELKLKLELEQDAKRRRRERKAALRRDKMERRRRKGASPSSVRAPSSSLFSLSICLPICPLVCVAIALDLTRYTLLLALHHQGPREGEL